MTPGAGKLAHDFSGNVMNHNTVLSPRRMLYAAICAIFAIHAPLAHAIEVASADSMAGAVEGTNLEPEEGDDDTNPGFAEEVQGSQPELAPDESFDTDETDEATAEAEVASDAPEAAPEPKTVKEAFA